MIIDPNAPNTGGGGGKRRPEVRAGKKLVWAAALEYGTSNANNKKFDVRWVVVEDPDGGTDVRGLFYDTYTLTQAAAWRVQALAKAVGQRTSWDAANADATWQVISRCPVWVTLVPETYNGKTRVKVSEVSLFGGEISEAMEDIVNEAEQWCRDGVAKRRQQGGAAGGASAYNAQPGGGLPDIEDGDIPF